MQRCAKSSEPHRSYVVRIERHRKVERYLSKLKYLRIEQALLKKAP